MEQRLKDIISPKRWQQLSYSIRQKIEVLFRARHTAKEIALLIGYSRRTVERELARGRVTLRRVRPDPYASVIPMERLYVESRSYSADVGQQFHDTRSTAKGPAVKLGKHRDFCQSVTSYIRHGYSPYSALKLLEHDTALQTPILRICTKTLYNYIHSGYIPGLTALDLPDRGKRRKRAYRRVRLAQNNQSGRSIEERPAEIALRTTFGHWEIDCVEGKSGTREALLVLSERMTRHELIFKLKRKTQDEVKRVLDGLERDYGIRRFRRIFRSLTCDNGCEFLNQSYLEKSVGKGNRTKVYYCHPYAAYERGTNENINRMIRRFIPKGTNIGSYSKKQIQQIQDRINSTPRLVLEGYPSNTRFKQYSG
jgi:IS30 family transposase